MSSQVRMELADVIYRFATDATFAAEVQRAPQRALAATGCSLDGETAKLLLALLRASECRDVICMPTWNTLDGPEWYGKPFTLLLSLLGPSAIS
jgi:hypothetical protein